MADFELKFEAEDVPAPGDYSVGKQARGKVEQEEVIGIALTGFELGDRLYSISFDIEDDREAYNTLVEAASEDELRESDEVQIGYRDDSGEHQRGLSGPGGGKRGKETEYRKHPEQYQ
jgi:hypothetical protein